MAIYYTPRVLPREAEKPRRPNKEKPLAPSAKGFSQGTRSLVYFTRSFRKTEGAPAGFSADQTAPLVSEAE